VSKDNLYELCKQVVEDSNALTKIWDKLDFHREKGYFPDEGQAKVSDIGDLTIADIVTKLLTLPSFISKTKKKIAAMEDGTAKDLLKADVRAKEIELNKIKELRHDKTI
jgi:hypothetical protein